MYGNSESSTTDFLTSTMLTSKQIWATTACKAQE
jgi:hypothetical protein